MDSYVMKLWTDILKREYVVFGKYEQLKIITWNADLIDILGLDVVKLIKNNVENVIVHTLYIKYYQCFCLREFML